ncbi:cytochrome b [Stakelama saccharophila]|uniref:Cytochrome b n=1 Tax=Stakelama saccharophila TaxID=3075605 RepID=A0ABZ0B5Y9_9SPHN|nr:cytochrome b [Stakelama sp. W311]WNO52710.1 cytochrome b [Stakelama sp. W311]
MAVLILINLPLGLLHEELERWTGASPMPIHKSIGICVLALAFVRLCWRMRHRPPSLPSLRPWERRAAGATHVLLYTMMLLLPLTGYVMTSAGAYPLVWFYLAPLPKLDVAPGSIMAVAAGSAHRVLGWTMLALATGHIAAALRHGVLLRDGVLARMVPWPISGADPTNLYSRRRDV